MSIITAILGLIKVIPIIDGWIQLFVSAYVANQIDTMKKENKDAIRKAIQDHDQRDLEKAIGNQNAGKPSGDAGSTIIDHPPPGLSD